MSADLRNALLATLAESPEDEATHAALADLLQESNDPAERAHGELIQVQLALAAEGTAGEDRRALQRREAALLGQHQQGWLGPLAPVLLGAPATAPEGPRAWWAYGWLDEVHLPRLTPATAGALAHCPLARLLRALRLGGEVDPQGLPLGPLLAAPFLDCLRVFQFGAPLEDAEVASSPLHVAAPGIVDLIERLPRIEELALYASGVDTRRLFALPNLGNLDTLVLYNQPPAFLDLLAENPNVGNLTTLRLHPHRGHSTPIGIEQVVALLESPHLRSLTHLHLHVSDLGDEGCRAIVASGILKRLRVLDLAYGRIGDRGAARLARCEAARGLERLVLSYNEITPDGEALLEEADVPFESDGQFEPGSEEYLPGRGGGEDEMYEGTME